MRHIYTGLFTLALPIIFIKLWVRGKNLKTYRNRWLERLAISNIHTTLKNQKTIWFHTVSVGEFIAAKPLIQHYIDQKKYNIVITTMTPSGSEQVKNTFGSNVSHVYTPYDLPFFILPFIKKIKPDIYIIMETELWPNTIHYCNKKQIPIILANARLSEKSAQGYARFPKFTKAILNNITCIAAQNENDAQRFIGLGLVSSKLNITGNIKFDLQISEETKKNATHLRKTITAHSAGSIWIAASTHRGEDDIILKAFHTVKNTHTHCKLILVPRHPDRFNEVYDLCLRYPYKTIKRSNNNADNNFDILLGDTMGELLTLYGCADFAFIGGSFVHNGGHNSIEAAAWGLPIISGPSTFNFHEITQLLQAQSALTLVADHTELSSKVIQLCSDIHIRRKEGLASKNVAQENKGALKKLIDIINANL